MRADLLRHSTRLSSWLDLRAWVRYPTPGGPLERALDREWWFTPELHFLRNISDSLDWLVWAKTEDGAAGRNRPRPTLLTEAEKRTADPDRGKWTALPIDELDARLGLTKKGGDSGY